MALALSMGEPPPTEMRVSMDESLATRSVASSSWATGACCLMLEKVPACLAPRSPSTCLIRGVLVARDAPVMMKA
jgi:hypothetical protein